MPSKQEAADKDIERIAQINITKYYFKTTAIWTVNLVAGIRGMCYTILKKAPDADMRANRKQILEKG